MQKYEDYSGSADVLYRDGNTYFYVSGSHCSCYGLEDNWEPEAYTLETLIGQFEAAKYGMFAQERDLLLPILKDRALGMPGGGK